MGFYLKIRYLNSSIKETWAMGTSYLNIMRSRCYNKSVYFIPEIRSDHDTPCIELIEYFGYIILKRVRGESNWLKLLCFRNQVKSIWQIIWQYIYSPLLSTYSLLYRLWQNCFDGVQCKNWAPSNWHFRFGPLLYVFIHVIVLFSFFCKYLMTMVVNSHFRTCHWLHGC